MWTFIKSSTNNDVPPPCSSPVDGSVSQGAEDDAGTEAEEGQQVVGVGQGQAPGAAAQRLLQVEVGGVVVELVDLAHTRCQQHTWRIGR